MVTETSILEINGQTIPPIIKGTMTLSEVDSFNEYKGENGESTIEEISTGMIEGSVNFRALLQSDLQTIYASITKVSIVRYYDPRDGQTKSINALIDNKNFPYKFKDANADVWGFSFSFRQIRR